MKFFLLFPLAVILSASNSFAQFTNILSFSGLEANPYGSLFSDGTYLYGMTKNGGTNNIGTIFKIKPDGTSLTKLFDFDSISGSQPFGSLISDGTFLYGMTNSGGGSPCQMGCGAIFKIKPDGTQYSKLFDFSVSDGFHPQGSLITDGVFLYGMTSQGGTTNPNHGVIFKIKLDGTGYVKLLDFNVTNGGLVHGSLISVGTYLYGMTRGGGANGQGVIFKIKPDGTGYVNILDFDPQGASTGAQPYGSLISDGTFLYGMTFHGGTGSCPFGGCGKIFKIKLDGTGYLDLHDFVDSPDGESPYGSLILDGNFLYGMTTKGGTTDAGIIFKIKFDGTGYSKLFDFIGDQPNGYYPYGSLISDSTFLYGMTSIGGAGYSYCPDGCGTIFKYSLVTGIAENNQKNGLNVYPNPSNGTFTIETKENNCILIITNVLGENIYESEIKNQKVEIDLKKQSNGIYFITIKTKNETRSKKLIINQ